MKIFYIQPILTSYRKKLIDKLHNTFDLTILCGDADNNSGFNSDHPTYIKTINAPVTKIAGGHLLMQSNVLRSIRTNKPDLVLACANIRDITYWGSLLLCRIMGIKVFSHGQGLYSKQHVSPLLALLYRTAIFLSYKYICYTPISRDSLISIGCPQDKLEVADNTIKFSVDAGDFLKRGDEQGILFVGRLRDQCGLEDLVKAVSILRKTNASAILHVVGSGELESEYRKSHNQSWVVFHGAIYDDSKILEISRECRVGCYPGNAGLSVVHYFSLRLPPIVHDDIYSHMGPEPSYIKNGINGITFKNILKPQTISEALINTWNMPLEQYLHLSNTSFSEYERLNNPSMETKILQILNLLPEEQTP